jgi:hypothetical protein
METTEKIVEAYVRYVRKWATIPNIKCPGQYEIDLLAIDPVNLNRYHIESGVSVSGSYSKLTVKDYSDEYLKMRVKAASQRRTIGYFIDRKFGAQPVIDTLEEYGFLPGQYSKIIVSWGWEEEAEKEAEKHAIQLWDFRDILREIAASFKKKRVYFTDDTLRTLQLFSLSIVYTQITSQKIPRGRYTAHSRDSSDHHQICVT